MKVTTDACLFGAWVAADLQRCSTPTENLLDIGAGSGLLSLMIRQKNVLKINAVEIDAEAVAQAKENVKTTDWKNDIEIIQQDLRQWKSEQKWNYIVSNPPFYENELKSGNKTKNMAHHDEGLDLTTLFSFIKTHLCEDGRFFLLLPFKREAQLNKLLKQFHFHLEKIVVVQPYQGGNNFRLLLKGGNGDYITESDTLAIKDEHNHYKAPFITLLKDYYLYL